MSKGGDFALITLFIDVLHDLVFHEDVAVQSRPVRHVDFLLPVLVRDCRSLESLGLFEQPGDVELERE